MIISYLGFNKCPSKHYTRNRIRVGLNRRREIRHLMQGASLLSLWETMREDRSKPKRYPGTCLMHHTLETVLLLRVHGLGRRCIQPPCFEFRAHITRCPCYWLVSPFACLVGKGGTLQQPLYSNPQEASLYSIPSFPTRSPQTTSNATVACIHYYHDYYLLLLLLL